MADYLSRDKAKTEALINRKKEEAQQAENQRIIKLAWASIRQIAIRQRDAATTKDPIAKAHLLDEIVRISGEVAQTDPMIWPWRFVAIQAAHHPTVSFVPQDGAVWESAFVVRTRADGTQYGGGEFGAVSYHPSSIGYRQYRELKWEPDRGCGACRVEDTSPAEWQRTAPAMEDELQAAVDRLMQQIQRGGSYVFVSCA